MTEGQSESEAYYLDDNRQFILYANYLHRDDIDNRNFLDENTRQLMIQNRVWETASECQRIGGHDITGLDKLETWEPIFRDNITRQTLDLAARCYFNAMFCSDHDPEMVEFYQNLLLHFPLETVLKSLARILFVTNKKKLTSDYIVAKTLFDKITTMMDLQYKDIVLLTTRATEIELYEDLEDHQLDPEFRDYAKIEGMIKHPVHISDNNETLSSLIPFCSFGGDFDEVGRRVIGLRKPVCRIFREKMVLGQVCYEADLSLLTRNQTNRQLKETLQRGFSFVVDINDEYDVKNLIKRRKEKGEEKSNTENLFKHSVDKDSLEIRLKTISNIMRVLNRRTFAGFRSRTDSSGGGRVVCSE